MALQRTRDSALEVLAIWAMFLEASGWSILFSAMTVGNFSLMKASTMLEMVVGLQFSRGSLGETRESVRATVCEVLP